MMKKIIFSLLTLFFLLSQFAVAQTTGFPPPQSGFPGVPLPKNLPPSSGLPSSKGLLPLPPSGFSTSGTSSNSTSNSSSNTTDSSNNNHSSPSPFTPPSPVVPPANIKFPNFPPHPTSPMGLDPAENNTLPIELECNIARLLVLDDNPVVAPDGSTPFAVTARVYASVLSLFASDDASQQILYTEKIKPYIDQHVDADGNYFYQVVSGAENTLLGYSNCLSATAFRDTLCADQSTFFTLDANVDSNQQTYFWIHFTTFFLSPEDESENGMTHYQWVNHTGIGDYYDFYLTKDQPDLSQVIPNSSGLCVRSFTGNIWAGSKDEAYLTHDWTVTGNKMTGLSTSSDGKPFILEPPADSTPEPTQSSDNSNQPATNSNKKKHTGSAWDDFKQNGSGSAWEAYQQRSSQAQDSSSNQNKNSSNPSPSPSPSAPAASPSDNNSSQQNAPIDKETEAKIQLAAKLYKEGKSLEQIESATGFTEEQLNYIFSHLSQ